MVSFIDENDKRAHDYGVNAKIDLSSRMLQKLEFGQMMIKQSSPVSDPMIQDDAKFKFCQKISKTTNLAVPILDLRSGKLNEIRIMRNNLSMPQVDAIARALPSMPQLNELHLEDTNLSDDSFALLLKSIVS